MERPAVSGFVFKTFHGARKQKELFCLCSVLFFMTRFSAEGSLPRIALPLEPGSEQGAPRGLAGLPSTHPPCPPPSQPTCPEKRRGLRLRGHLTSMSTMCGLSLLPGKL